MDEAPSIRSVVPATLPDGFAAVGNADFYFLCREGADEKSARDFLGLVESGLPTLLSTREDGTPKLRLLD